MTADHIDPRRRFLLRGRIAQATAPQVAAVPRPPWALAEARFVERCTRCDDCIGACPQHIVVRGDGGYPEVRFDQRGCTFCGACADACAVGALQRGAPGTKPWTLLARVDEAACLAHRGVECRVCGERCEAGAIRFRPTLGSPPRPQVDGAACTGCGECVTVCPSHALSVRIPA